MPKKIGKIVPGDTRFRWDRAINNYWVVAVLKDKKGDVQENRSGEVPLNEASEQTDNDWEGYIIRLPQPIWCAKKRFELIKASEFRLYPPFKIDMRGQEGGAFKDVKLPSVTGCNISIPDHAVLGANAAPSSDGTEMCHGLRIDLRKGAGNFEIIQSIKEIVRERTRQWWINAPNNPFDFGYKLSFRLTSSFEIPEPAQIPGKEGRESSWRGMASTQMLTGIERPVDVEEWSAISAALTASQPREQATHFLMEAISKYMCYRDEDCIVDLCISLEIMECKSRKLDGKKFSDYGTKLLKGAALWGQNDRADIIKLFADRGHIAHGKRPPNYGRDQMQIVKYLELAVANYQKFLDRSKGVGWHNVAKLLL